MKQRSKLQTLILNAWGLCITEDYIVQRINSERSLQASFWSKLNSKLLKSRRMFIEPSMSIETDKGNKRIIPDIVICSRNSVICVIELKYNPRIGPRYRKDVKSLSNISKNRRQIEISNVKFRGVENDSKKYHLSKYILFVWAGIHSDTKPKITSKSNLYSFGYKGLSKCFMELHAETEKLSDPKIYARYRGDKKLVYRPYKP